NAALDVHSEANYELAKQETLLGYLAASWRDNGIPVMQLLLEHGADSRHQNSLNRTPYDTACFTSAALPDNKYVKQNAEFLYQWEKQRIEPLTERLPHDLVRIVEEYDGTPQKRHS